MKSEYLLIAGHMGANKNSISQYAKIVIRGFIYRQRT